MVFVYFESNPSAKSHYKPRFHGEMLLNRLKPETQNRAANENQHKQQNTISHAV